LEGFELLLFELDDLDLWPSDDEDDVIDDRLWTRSTQL
jgi:hypothetical protein